MERQKKKRTRRLLWGGIGLGIGILGIVYVTFSASFNRVYRLLLEKDMIQTEFTSEYVTKLIETELENVIANMQVSQGILLRKRNEDPILMAEQLTELRAKMKFEKLAVCNLNGEGIDWEGNELHVEQSELLEAAAEGRYYISAVVNELDAILMAVPIMKEQTPVGILCGHYQVERIAETIELDANSQRYFQLVDNSGRYISDSHNVNSFARDEDIWKEIHKYQLSDGVTAEDIRKDVEAGRSGSFHFTYHGEGRYVTYEPLGINNWYVFSVLTEDYVTGYVMEVEGIFSALLWGILACIALALLFIGKEIYRTMKLIRVQNEKLSARNSLLFMVLKHTNDIPFEVDLNKQTVTVYRMNDQEEMVVQSQEEYFPDHLMEKQILDSGSYETYKRICSNIMNLKDMEPEVIKIRIHGMWMWNKVHYRVINQNHLVGFLENYNEQVYQYEKMKEIDRKSRLDPLTGLYNRAYFKYEVEQLIGKYELSPKPGYSALFLLDLDYFKQANDILGHIEGDRILKETALAMRSSVRSTDLCGRLGGDEFVVFIEGVRDMDALQICAKKLNEVLCCTYGTGERKVSISASIGIAVWTSETAFDELYRLADVALYRVKKSGRNGFYVISKDTEKEEEMHHGTDREK